MKRIKSMQIEAIKKIEADFSCFMCHHETAEYHVKLINHDNEFRLQLCLCVWCRNFAIEAPDLLSQEFMRKEGE